MVSSVSGSVSDCMELSWSNQKPNCSAGRMHTVTSRAITARDTATCSPNSGMLAASHTAMPPTDSRHQPMCTRCNRGPWKNTTYPPAHSRIGMPDIARLASPNNTVDSVMIMST